MAGVLIGMAMVFVTGSSVALLFVLWGLRRALLEGIPAKERRVIAARRSSVRRQDTRQPQVLGFERRLLERRNIERRAPISRAA